MDDSAIMFDEVTDTLADTGSNDKDKKHFQEILMKIVGRKA